MIRLETPIGLDAVRALNVGDEVELCGTVVTARDAAHKLMVEDRPDFIRPLLKGALNKDGVGVEVSMKTVREIEREMGEDMEDEVELEPDSTNEIASISNIKGMGGKNEAKWAQVVRRWIREA